MSDIVIWAQSVCRSTMALYREVKRQAGVPVAVVLRRNACGECAQQLREAQGQGADEFADVVDIEWDGELGSGREILNARTTNHELRIMNHGTVHVFSGYQVSAAVRQLICEAHEKGCRVVEYDEAPCEMCVGAKALLKRMYYRWILSRKVGRVTSAADLFLNASGRQGIDRLVRLGWARENIVPFGYASDVVGEGFSRVERVEGSLRILHTGMEGAYRNVGTLRKAVEILCGKGVKVKVESTGGRVSAAEMPRLYKWADVFVACGLCEPWGMRVNDAIHAGLPVVVSSGMGVEWLVEQFGCGCVYEKGKPQELAKCLERFAADGEFRRRLASGVELAHGSWLPEARAKVLLDILKQ